MKQIELIEWAIAVINAEIDKLATARIKGYSLLDVVKRGETNRIIKSIEESKALLNQRKRQLMRLSTIERI